MNTKVVFRCRVEDASKPLGTAPDPLGLSTVLDELLAGGEGLAAPNPSPKPRSVRPFGRRASAL